MSDQLPDILPISQKRQLKRLVWWTIDVVGAWALLGGLAYFAGLGPLWIALICAFVLAIGLSFITYRANAHLTRLRKWSGLTGITDLVDFAQSNKSSDYMPAIVLSRDSVKNLSVMGNGCGKWVHKVDGATARQKFRAMRAANGTIRFLASCPIHLALCGDDEIMKKAYKNAESLVELRKRQQGSGGVGGRFEIRTYKHLATLRLIIIDDRECIIGHYQEDGIGDSIDTPLLVFRCNDENEWGFGHAFRRLFESEWNRSSEPTAAEWEEIEKLGKEGPPQ